MINVENLEVLSPKQYVRPKAKEAQTQALNNCLLYNLIRKNIIYAISTFSYLIYKQDLLVHCIAYLSLKRVNLLKGKYYAPSQLFKILLTRKEQTSGIFSPHTDGILGMYILTPTPLNVSSKEMSTTHTYGSQSVLIYSTD